MKKILIFGLFSLTVFGVAQYIVCANYYEKGYIKGVVAEREENFETLQWVDTNKFFLSPPQYQEYMTGSVFYCDYTSGCVGCDGNFTLYSYDKVKGFYVLFSSKITESSHIGVYRVVISKDRIKKYEEYKKVGGTLLFNTISAPAD